MRKKAKRDTYLDTTRLHTRIYVIVVVIGKKVLNAIFISMDLYHTVFSALLFQDIIKDLNHDLCFLWALRLLVLDKKEACLVPLMRLKGDIASFFAIFVNIRIGIKVLNASIICNYKQSAYFNNLRFFAFYSFFRAFRKNLPLTDFQIKIPYISILYKNVSLLFTIGIFFLIHFYSEMAST